MKVETIILNNKEYIILDKVKMNDTLYYILGNEQDPTDICIRKEIEEISEKYLVGLDDEKEFNLVIQNYINRKNEKIIPVFPIGTVVNLHDCLYDVMIIGYSMKNKEGITYEYCGCECPIGFTAGKNMLYFDRVNITAIKKVGYIDEDAKNILSKIEKFYQQNQNK